MNAKFGTVEDAAAAARAGHSDRRPGVVKENLTRIAAYGGPARLGPPATGHVTQATENGTPTEDELSNLLRIRTMARRVGQLALSPTGWQGGGCGVNRR